MELWQAALIALFAYLGRKQVPWLFGITGGWWGIGRPLVAGAICGLILGDVKAGVLCGIAVQALFIGQITPGGALPSDVNLAAYIGIPLAIASGGGAEMAVALSIPLGALGVAMFQFLMMFNTVLPHYDDKCAERGDARGIRRASYAGAFFMFVERFPLVMLTLYFGAPFAEGLFSLLPPMALHFLAVAGGLLPALGFAILLKQILSEKWMLILFVLGWVLVAVVKLPTVAVVCVAGAAALLYSVARYSNGGKMQTGACVPYSMEDEEGNYDEF